MGLLSELFPPASPGKSERALLTTRARRLAVRTSPDDEGQGWVRSAEWATANLERIDGLAPAELSIRREFSFRLTDPPVAVTDRRPAAREHRPSATRLMSSRSAALRLYLTILAVAQKSGWRPASRDNPLPVAGGFGWVDLVAGALKKQGAQRMVTDDRDDRLRTVHSALRALNAAGLVELPHDDRPKGTYDGFKPLREGGAMLQASVPYAPPQPREHPMTLPYTFISNGWVHLLEDSEIALLLMVACGLGSLDEPDVGQGWVAIPAITRLSRYGLSRDAFDAHRMLDRFGLLDVHGVGRHYDDLSRVSDYGEKAPQLHRLALLRDGFAHSAFKVVPREVARRLGE